MTYPLPRPDNGDPRFTGELIDAVADLLAAHGYPAANGDDTDFAGLRDALARFLYGPEFNTGDRVAWYCDGKVWTGLIEVVADTGDGPVARISADPQPGDRGRTTSVVACSALTLTPWGAS